MNSESRDVKFEYSSPCCAQNFTMVEKAITYNYLYVDGLRKMSTNRNGGGGKLPIT